MSSPRNVDAALQTQTQAQLQTHGQAHGQQVGSRSGASDSAASASVAGSSQARGSATSDPLAALADLPGVSDAVEQAVDYIARVHRHKANLRGWNVTGTESVLRGARASAHCAGGEIILPADGQVRDPILAGAFRVAELLDPQKVAETQGVWRRAPLQIMAKINALATPIESVSGGSVSNDTVPSEAAGQAGEAAGRAGAMRLGDNTGNAENSALVPGRPRAETHARLQLLAEFITGGTSINAVILSAVVHGELLALHPFAQANGVTARACARLTCIATGLDPRGLAVPEVWWDHHRAEYERAVQGFAEGTPEGVAQWIIFHARGLAEGALEAKSIADAM